MTLPARAQRLQVELTKLLASPAAALLPAPARGLLAMQSHLLVALAERIETLERKLNV
jgi:hypothetical protein